MTVQVKFTGEDFELDEVTLIYIEELLIKERLDSTYTFPANFIEITPEFDI